MSHSQASHLLSRLEEATKLIQSRCPARPQVGLILGSGLSSIADQMTDTITIPYSEIPHFQMTAVEGHVGQLVMGKMNEIPVALLQGRFHFYEGHSINQVAFPAQVLCKLGVQTLVLTNAAGGINTRFRPGDLMLIEDHINLMGANPLMGPNHSEIGPRFPDLSEAYHLPYLETVEKTAAELEIRTHRGVYVGLLGPTYETPAEVRMLRTLGADAVGMSTVPETIAANHMGVRVVGMSCITNQAAGLSPQKLSHQEVIDTSKAAAEKMKKLLFNAIPRIASQIKESHS